MVALGKAVRRGEQPRRMIALASALAAGALTLATMAPTAHATPILNPNIVLSAALPIIPAIVFDQAMLLGTGGVAPDGDDIAPPAAARGETLEHVLRSIVSVHAIEDGGRHAKTPEPVPGKQRTSPRDSDELERAYRAAYRLLLDSEALGDAMRWAVQSKVGQDGKKAFSLFGRGAFELDVVDAGSELRLSELSIGVSLPISEKATETAVNQAATAQGDDSGGENGESQSSSQLEEHFSLHRYVSKIAKYVRSTEGKFLLLLGGALIVLIGTARAGLRMSRRRRGSAFDASIRAQEEFKRPMARGIPTGTPRRA
jgi:hypothetical protein